MQLAQDTGADSVSSGNWQNPGYITM